MDPLNTLITVIEGFILLFFAISVFYIFIFSVAGIFTIKRSGKSAEKPGKFAVMIPGYKEDNVILDVAKDALNQDYPEDMYDVIIIADSFKKETLEELRKLPIILIEVSFENSTKSKALNAAMKQLPDNNYDFAVILDADNLMEKSFLTKVNNRFTDAFTAIQAHRTAKNTDTSLAILDAISEEINNHIFRKGHRTLGLSSAIIGSGMVFRYAYFKELMSGVNAVGGFDKEIELKMLRDRNKIEYLEDAYVYDEKVQKANNFSNQRRRWLSAQVHYLRKYFFNSVAHLVTRRNTDYFDKALQMLLLPRALIIGGVPSFFIVSFLLNYFGLTESFAFNAWGLLLLITVFSLIIAVPKRFYTIHTLKALFYLPKGILLMVFSLLKIKGANKKFIHTAHGN